MRLVFQDDQNAWVIVFNGKTVAIGGTTFFTEKDDALAEIHKRGLVVLEDGSLVKASEVPAAEPEPEVTAPPAEETDEEISEEVEVVSAETLESTEEVIASPVPDPAIESLDRQALEEAERAAHSNEPLPGRARDERLAQNRESYHRRSPERAAEVQERSKDWWKSNPDKAREYRRRANEKRKERYTNDPEYRAKVQEANRAYQQRKRAAKETPNEPGD